MIAFRETAILMEGFDTIQLTNYNTNNLSPCIAMPIGPTSRKRLEFIVLRYLQDYMLVTHIAIPLKEAL